MRQKGVALIVAVLMVWTLSLPAVAAVNPFSDVRSDHWAYDAIVGLASMGLIEGYPDGTFGGDRTFTRYEMAMVFARILARFEALIDQRISEGIDAKADRLAQEIQLTRQALEEKIDNQYDDLLARIASLAEEVGALTDGTVSVAPGGDPLTPEVREILAEHAANDLVGRLAELREDMDDLARRVLRLEGSTPSRGEAKSIAEQVVADALAEFAGDVELAQQAAAEEEGATARLLERKVDELSDSIQRLAAEFQPELERLGVRVADLERRVDELDERVDLNRARIARNQAVLAEHDDEIRSLWDSFGNVKLTGKNVTTFDHVYIVDGNDQSIDEALKDPRDPDGDKYEKKDEFKNEFIVNLTATPAENVEVKAELALVSEPFGEDAKGAVDPSLTLELTTPGVLRSLYVGELDHADLATPFDKYVMDEERLDDLEEDDDVEFRGSRARMVWGQGDSTALHGFLSRFDKNDYAFGAAIGYTMSEAFDLKFQGVRDTGENDSVMAFQSAGRLDQIDYSAKIALHNEDSADTNRAMEVAFDIPLGAAVALGVRHGDVEKDFKPRYAKELESWDDERGPDWIDRMIHPKDDWLEPGERETSATLSASVIGIPARLAAGRRVDNADTAKENTYGQLALGTIHFAGIDADFLADVRSDEDEDIDRTFLAHVGTSIIGVDVGVDMIDRVNDQLWASTGWIDKEGNFQSASEGEQKHTLVTATKDIELFVPFTLTGRYGVSRSAQAKETPYTFIGVEVKEVPVGPLALSAGYSTAKNDLDVDYWWQNASWSHDERDEFMIGLGYTIPEFFGVDLKTGYEYKQVQLNSDQYSRNTLTASFEKELRRATISGEAKYMMGYLDDEDGNENDLIAKLNLVYPVFENGDLKLGGAYVSSRGTKADEYTVYRLNAGLEVAF